MTSRLPVLLSGLVVLGLSADAGAVFDCLPKPNCRNVQECCKKPRKELLIQIARAELRRDFYNSQKNRDEAFAKGAWSSTNTLEKAFKEFISAHQDVAAKQRLGIRSNQLFDDVPDLTTHPDCTTSIDANRQTVKITDIPGLFDDPNNPLTKANVCREAVVAAIHHESEHQDRCEAKKAGLLPPSKEASWARRELDDHADDERNAYAVEAEKLRRMARQARRRCTTAKALANDDFQNAKQKLQALRAMRQPRSW